MQNNVGTNTELYKNHKIQIHLLQTFLYTTLNSPDTITHLYASTSVTETIPYLTPSVKSAFYKVCQKASPKWY